MCKSYGDSEFIGIYNKLLFHAQKGNIKYFHRLSEIKKLYAAEKRLGDNPLFFIKAGYINSVLSFITEAKTKIYKIIDLVNSNDYKYLTLNYFETINRLQIKINIFELKIKSIKNSIIDINNKLDFELRRKIGNLILDQIFNEYFNNLESIQKTEYILALSIENIEEKINILNKKKEIGQENKNLGLLKNHLNKALSLLNQITSNKIEKINTNNFDISNFIKNNVNIQFKNNNNEKNEIHKAIILNLFLILRKILNEIMNDSIHNETIELNSLVKEEISKLEKLKENDNFKISNTHNSNGKNTNNINNNKLNNNNYINIIDNDNSNLNNKNNIEIDKNIIDENNNNDIYIKNALLNQENQKIIEIKSNKKCKIDFKQINSIKDKFPNVKKIFETNDEFLEKSIMKINSEIPDSSIHEFNDILENINKSYKILPEIIIENALDLFIEGKKSSLLVDIYNFKNSNNVKNYLNNLYEKEEVCDDLLFVSNKILKDINENLIYFGKMKNKFCSNIEKYGKFFNIQNIIEEYKIELPFQPMEIVNSLEVMSNLEEEEEDDDEEEEIDKLEKNFFIIQICGYFILEESICHLIKVRDIIKNLNIEDLIKKNRIKNKLINEMNNNLSISNEKNLYSEAWKKIQKTVKFIENNEELNELIKKYVQNNEKSEFKKDLKNLLGPVIKKINLDEKDPQNLFLTLINYFMKK